MTDSQKQKLLEYIYEWGYTYGRYYHTDDAFSRAKEVLQTPEEFIESL